MVALAATLTLVTVEAMPHTALSAALGMLPVMFGVAGYAMVSR